MDPITTIPELQAHLREAVQIEFSTIPLYLYAMYSIEDTESEAYITIRSVVIEEMLHMALARNTLLAVGGQISLYDATIMPTFPMQMPHRTPALTLNLARCSTDLIRDTFMQIELPDDPVNLQQLAEQDTYHTLGEFYAAIIQGIHTCYALYGPQLFANNDPTKQLVSGYYPVEGDHFDSGSLILVEDVASAIRALDIIVEQGEGLTQEIYDDPDQQELAHYYKFQQMADGVIPLGPIYPVPENPTTSQYADPNRKLSNFFNACYCYLLWMLDQVYSISDSRTKQQYIFDGVLGIMDGILKPTAQEMVQQASQASPGTNVAPTFQYYNLYSSQFNMKTMLLLACQQLKWDFPDLMVSTWEMIERLPPKDLPCQVPNSPPCVKPPTDAQRTTPTEARS